MFRAFLQNRFFPIVQSLRSAASTPAPPEPPRTGLMEFFDDPKNWAQPDVRVGRSWKLDELRIKSNEDLHKLWFVLLKERNMLMTMEEEYRRRIEAMPAPERLDKVKESMVNLEEVVRERDRAYYQLETGETGERPGKLAENRIGMNYFYKFSEHFLPLEMNRSWFSRKVLLGSNRKEVAQFKLFLNEKIWLQRKKQRTRDRSRVMALLRRFPDLDIDAVKEQYPDVDIEKVKQYRRARGHNVPN